MMTGEYEILTREGALTGPTSERSWWKLHNDFGFSLVLQTIRALRADTRQPVNAADVRSTLTRAVRLREFYAAVSIDIPQAVTPARSTQPMSTRPVSTAPTSSTPAAVQTCGTTTAAGSWMSAEQIPARVIAAIQRRKIGRSVAAAEMGMSPYTLIRLLEGVNTKGVHFTTLNKLLAWLEKQPTSLATTRA